VFDAPYTHPETDFRGVQLFEWGTWAHYWQRMSTPPDILRRLQKACGSYPLGMEANDMGLSYIDPADMQRRLVASTAAKAQAAAWLLAETPWDLSFVVFGETHPAAHYCWSSATEHTGNGSTDQYMLRPVYEAVDRGIATLLAGAGDDTTVFVVSGDGVGPNHSGWHLLPGVLQRLGFLVSSDPASVEAVQQHDEAYEVGQGKRDPIKALRNLIPKDLRKQVARRLPARLREALARRVDLGGIDWSQTRAYCLPTDLEGCIRINLQGREPAGIVRVGAEYQAVCDELTAALGELVDPTTGRPAVRQVIRTDEVFPGRRRAYLPDLIVLWTEGSQLTQLTSPKIGTVTHVSPDARPGTHTATAFVLAHGPAIDPGTTIAGAHVLDFAPTMLSRFTMRLPDHLEGRPWHTLLTR
jgi:predicted AlkP superfamily phosphohydrolase/phosphomutase